MTRSPRPAAGSPRGRRHRSPLGRLARAAGRSVEAGVVGLFVAGMAARYVPPPTLWGLQLVAVAVPYLAVAVGVAAVGAALGRRGVPALAYALLLGIGQVLALRAGTEPAALRSMVAPGTEPRLAVLTFNAGSSGAPPSEEAMAETLTRHRPHILALQEFSVRTFHASGITAGGRLLVPILAGGTYTVSTPEGTGRATRNHLPVFARIDATAPAQLLAGKPAEDLWASGGVTRAQFEWEGQPVAVYSVHLHSFSEKRPWEGGRRHAVSPAAWRAALREYREDFRQRAAQARRLRALLEAEPYPYLVCGDLNSTPDSWVYSYVARGMTDVFKVAGQGWGMTFPSRLPLVRIDFILASSHWDVHEARVERGLVSDHLPIVAQLSLRL